jgi:hypothetical protein
MMLQYHRSLSISVLCDICRILDDVSVSASILQFMDARTRHMAEKALAGGITKVRRNS